MEIRSVSITVTPPWSKIHRTPHGDRSEPLKEVSISHILSVSCERAMIALESKLLCWLNTCADDKIFIIKLTPFCADLQFALYFGLLSKTSRQYFGSAHGSDADKLSDMLSELSSLEHLVFSYCCHVSALSHWYLMQCHPYFRTSMVLPAMYPNRSILVGWQQYLVAGCCDIELSFREMRRRFRRRVRWKIEKWTP